MQRTASGFPFAESYVFALDDKRELVATCTVTNRVTAYTMADHERSATYVSWTTKDCGAYCARLLLTDSEALQVHEFVYRASEAKLNLDTILDMLDDWFKAPTLARKLICEL
jgi:hypothetical protein